MATRAGQAEFGAASKFDGELSVEFVRRCREESAKRILKLKVNNQAPAASLWLKWTMSIAGVAEYQNQYYDTLVGEPRNKKPPPKSPLWVEAIRCCYYYATLKMLVTCLLQYAYDFYKKQCESLTQQDFSNRHTVVASISTAVSTATTATNSSSSLEQFEQKKRLLRSLIKLLGSPYMEFSYIVETCCMCVIVTSLSAYLLPQLHIARHGLNISILATLLDRQREQTHQDNIMLNELSSFLTSSRQYVRTRLVKSSRLKGHLWAERSEENFQALRDAIRGHAEALAALKRMALAGQLQPINRSPQQLLKISRWYYVFSQSAMLATMLFGTITLMGPLIRASSNKLQSSPMDILALVEVAFMIIMVNISSSFYLPMITLACIDNIALVVGLRHKLSQCIASSDELQRYSCSDEHRGPLDGAQSSCRKRQRQRYANRLNARALLIFIHYRIFVSQLRSFQRIYDYVAMITILTVATVAFICISHARYFDAEETRWAIAVALIVIISGELCLAPVGFMHARCQQLYHSFHSLGAHLTQAHHQSTTPPPPPGNTYWRRPSPSLYNPHLMRLIQKELSEPELRLAQFAPAAFGFRLTYMNFLKFHFWSGLLLTSALVSSHGESRWSLVSFL